LINMTRLPMKKAANPRAVKRINMLLATHQAHPCLGTDTVVLLQRDLKKAYNPSKEGK